MFLYLAYQNVHQPQEVPEQYELPYLSIHNEQRRTLAGKRLITLLLSIFKHDDL